MRVLVFCDDRWHPASVVKSGLDPLVDDGFEFTYIENMADWTPDMIKGFPVVILAKSNNFSSTDTTEWATEEAQSVFESYVQNGGGLLAIHSGTAGYMEANIIRGILGGVFTHHPEQCPVTVEAVDGHVITHGFEPFTLKDEHYFIEIDNNVDLCVFLASTSQHGRQPAGWVRIHGKGKVCVLTPGHNLDVWLHPSFQLLLRNSLNWLVKD
ncbi:ThuA domain-containing protein [Caldicoprobacter algeriensis]|uniref:ThuA domain-containing protein n=1 Tax=Caldicoprobacter algeriensis TaxID=699281 RepID=UPI002079793A|nr:ThuA domain-containing protein [Caldicoprobacter algeriensis]MCM8899641.1 ThuA domain-containing protein [Caldicoprobacter algeriensis]